MYREVDPQLEREFNRRNIPFSFSNRISTPIQRARFYEFNKYLEETGITKCYLKAMQLMIDEEMEDEQDPYLMLQKACGDVEVDTVDTTNTMAEIDACKERIESAKKELKEAMLKYLDAVERSTSDDIFIETDLSSRRKKPYHRAACLLKQFGCKTRVRHIKRLREEIGITPTPVTSSQMRHQRLLKYLTDSELSFIKNCEKPSAPVVLEDEEEFFMAEDAMFENEEDPEIGMENLFSENETFTET